MSFGSGFPCIWPVFGIPRYSICESYLKVFEDIVLRKSYVDFIIIGTWNIGVIHPEKRHRMGSVLDFVLDVCSKASGCVIVYGYAGDIPNRELIVELSCRYRIPIIYQSNHHAKYIITRDTLYVGSANLTEAALLGLNIETYALVNIRFLKKGKSVNILDSIDQFLSRVRQEMSEIMTNIGIEEKLIKMLEDKLNNVINSLEALLHNLRQSSHKHSNDDPSVEYFYELMRIIRSLCAEPLNSVSTTIRFLINFPGLTNLPSEINELVDELLKVEHICNNVIYALTDANILETTLKQVEDIVNMLKQYLENRENLRKIIHNILKEVNKEIAIEQVRKLEKTYEEFQKTFIKENS